MKYVRLAAIGLTTWAVVAGIVFLFVEKL